MPLGLLLTAAAAAIARHREVSRSLLHWLRNLLLAELGLLLVMAAAGAIYQAVASARDQRRYPAPGQLIDMGGYRLHLYCAGEGGPTVVLDYGLVGSYLDWHFVQPEVARFTRVCSYDRGGYGWSDPSPRPRIPSAMAEELHTLLEKAGEKPPFLLVGHSAGALNVRMYAHRYREQVAGIVLVDGSHPDEYLPFYWRNKIWLRLMQLSAPLGLPRWRGWCVEGPAAVRPMKGAFNCQARIYRTNYEEWAAFPQGAQEVRNLGSLDDLPLFVISRDPNRQPREPDEYVLPAREERWTRFQADLARLSSNTTHVIAKDSGHAVLSERPDVVVEGIRHLVEEVRSKKPPQKAQPPTPPTRGGIPESDS